MMEIMLKEKNPTALILFKGSEVQSKMQYIKCEKWKYVFLEEILTH